MKVESDFSSNDCHTTNKLLFRIKIKVHQSKVNKTRDYCVLKPFLRAVFQLCSKMNPTLDLKPYARSHPNKKTSSVPAVQSKPFSPKESIKSLGKHLARDEIQYRCKSFAMHNWLPLPHAIEP